MVYHDLSEQSVGRQKPERDYFKASIVDRAFSFLLDYIIFSPVVSFFLLTFFQSEVSLWKDQSHRAENLPIFALLALAYVFIFSLLQTVFIYFWGGTPGQFFLKLKVQINPSPGLIFLRLWLRQAAFWSSALFLGIPWFAVLAHPEQKTFYDRLAETVVVSLKRNQKYFSFEVEAKYWRSLMATFSVFFVIMFLGYAWQQHTKIRMAAYTFAQFKQKDYFCPELKSIPQKERLQTAVALNLVGQLSNDCTDREADFVLWKTRDTELQSLAYYAKSLTEDVAVDEDRYLEKACDGDKNFFGCQIATAFSDEKLSDFYESLKKSKGEKNLLASVLQYEIGVVLDKTQQEDANFKDLKKFDRSRLVKKYLLGELLDRRLKNFDALNVAAKNGSGGRSPAAVSDVKRQQNDYKYAQRLIDQM